MNTKVFEFYLDFMNKGLVFAKVQGSLTVSEENFAFCTAVIDFVRNQFRALSTALGISFA